MLNAFVNPKEIPRILNVPLKTVYNVKRRVTMSELIKRVFDAELATENMPKILSNLSDRTS